MKQSNNQTNTKKLTVCPSCGAWVRIDRSLCPWCGHELEIAEGITPQSTDEPLDRHPYAPLFAEPEHTFQEVALPQDDMPPPRRPLRFWLTLFGAATLALVLFSSGMAVMGAYQGMQDRASSQRQEAVRYFERGQSLLTEGRYELATASFEAALALEPSWEAAQQGLAAAEAGQQGTAVPVTPIATMTPRPNEAQLLWQQAQQAIENQEWDEAADALDRLGAVEPGFESEQVKALGFETHLRAGLQARDDGNFDLAVLHFDHALAARPDDVRTLQERELASSYRTASEAWDDEDWRVAANELRRVYLINPEYLDVGTRLGYVHVPLADEYYERSIWCDAGSEYRAALSLIKDVKATQRLADSEARCTARVEATAGPPAEVPTAFPTFPPEPTVEVEETPEPEITPTVFATPSPSPTSADPLARPTAGATPTIFSGTGESFVLADTPGEDLSGTCSGQMIRGQIIDAQGAPLPNVMVVATDEWGNTYIGTSKQDPAGFYDIPIPASPTSYSVTILAGGIVQSGTITLLHDERLANSPVACHIVNWRQSR